MEESAMIRLRVQDNTEKIEKKVLNEARIKTMGKKLSVDEITLHSNTLNSNTIIIFSRIGDIRIKRGKATKFSFS